MRPVDQEKHARIAAALRRYPRYTNSAIAKLTGCHRETVAKVRTLNGISSRHRVDASGRKARGRRQVSYRDEVLPDGSVILYRVYQDRQRLCVGTSLAFLYRLGNYGHQPWWPRMTSVTGTKYLGPTSAWQAERLAIATEEPRYNVGRLGRVTLAVLTRHARMGRQDVKAAVAAARAAPPVIPPPLPGVVRIKRPRGRVKV